MSAESKELILIWLQGHVCLPTVLESLIQGLEKVFFFGDAKVVEKECTDSQHKEAAHLLECAR